MIKVNLTDLKLCQRDFPGGPLLKRLPYNSGDVGSIPGQGCYMGCNMLHGQKEKKKETDIQDNCF